MTSPRLHHQHLAILVRIRTTKAPMQAQVMRGARIAMMMSPRLRHLTILRTIQTRAPMRTRARKGARITTVTSLQLHQHLPHLGKLIRPPQTARPLLATLMRRRASLPLRTLVALRKSPPPFPVLTRRWSRRPFVKIWMSPRKW